MQEFLTGTSYTVLYYILTASSALLIRRRFRIPDEVFRKLLHFILLGSLPVCVFGFDTWYRAALFCIVFAVVVYPILLFFERFKTYSETVTERKKGELKSSLLLVFSMFALVLTVTWGWLGDRMLALISVYAWGIGDAAAALVGKHFGTHKIPRTKKSVEGTFSMFAVSFLTVFALLLVHGGMPVSGSLVTALLVGAVSAAAELYTPGGFDTVTCPLASMAVLLPLVTFFGGRL